MMKRKTMTKSLLATASLCMLMPVAQAQTSPYYLGAGLGVTRDDNVFRLPDGTGKLADSVLITTLVAGIDQPISRQRVRADATVRNNHYSNESVLNNVSYGLSGALDWETVDRLSGSVRLEANQSLARFSPGEGPTLTTKKNVQSNRAATANVRLGVVTRMTLEAEIGHYELDYSASEFLSREVTQDSAFAGIRYAFSGDLSAGAGIRATRGRYPQALEFPEGSGTFLPNKFTNNQLDLSADWRVTGASKLTGRLGIGKRKYSVASDLASSGVTGRLGWEWVPGGRLRLNTTLARDEGQSLELLSATGTTSGEVDRSRMTTALRTSATYELTGKVMLTASLGHSRRTLADVSSTAGTERGHDRTNTLAFGARWTPLRSVVVSCDLSVEKRSSDGIGSLPFSANTFGCAAQAILQ